MSEVHRRGGGDIPKKFPEKQQGASVPMQDTDAIIASRELYFKKISESPVDKQLIHFINESQYWEVEEGTDAQTGQLSRSWESRIPGKRGTIRSTDAIIAIKRTNLQQLGEVFAYVGDSPIRENVDCLDIDDFTIYASPEEQPLKPVEDFLHVAFREFPGQALLFQNVTDPLVEEWCTSRGWQEREKQNGEHDFYLLLPPYEQRHSGRIDLNAWTSPSKDN